MSDDIVAVVQTAVGTEQKLGCKESLGAEFLCLDSN